MKAIFVKSLGVLRPADPDAEAMLAKIPFGTMLMVEFRRPRNVRHHRLLFAMLRLVVENCNRYQTTEMLLDALKIATGHCDRYPSTDGTLVFVRPKSIAFESMDQTEFNAWFDRVVQIVCTQIIPGLDRDDLLTEIENMIKLPNYGGA